MAGKQDAAQNPPTFGRYAEIPAEQPSAEQKDACDFIMKARRIPERLYRRAIALIGDAGLTDLTVLIGYFTSVSMTLAAYDVPAGASDYRPYK
jgi:hypothetical protein